MVVSLSGPSPLVVGLEGLAHIKPALFRVESRFLNGAHALASGGDVVHKLDFTKFIVLSRVVLYLVLLFPEKCGSVPTHSPRLRPCARLCLFRAFIGLRFSYRVGWRLGSDRPTSIFTYTYIYIIKTSYSNNLGIHFARSTGVEHVGGDMFASVPRADAVFMKVSPPVKASLTKVVVMVNNVVRNLYGNIIYVPIKPILY